MTLTESDWNRDRIGHALSEESTACSATRIRLEQSPGPIVTNISTTVLSNKIAALHGDLLFAPSWTDLHLRGHA